MRLQTLNDMVRQASVRAGIVARRDPHTGDALPGITAHGLRRTFATSRGLRSGLTMGEVSKLLGHAEERTTARFYGAYATNFMSEASARLVPIPEALPSGRPKLTVVRSGDVLRVVGASSSPPGHKGAAAPSFSPARTVAAAGEDGAGTSSGYQTPFVVHDGEAGTAPEAGVDALGASLRKKHHTSQVPPVTIDEWLACAGDKLEANE